MIRKGDVLTLKPQWCEEGEEAFTYVARDNEEQGRFYMSAMELIKWPIWPSQITSASMVEARPKTAVGTRVVLVSDVEVYPLGIFRAGLTGTLTRVEPDCYWVKLDQHQPTLDDWDNELQIWDYSPENDGLYHPETYIKPIA
jgi:hypothetical protein